MSTGATESLASTPARKIKTPFHTAINASTNSGAKLQKPVYKRPIFWYNSGITSAMTDSYPATRHNLKTKLRPGSCSVDHIVRHLFYEQRNKTPK